MLNSQGENRMEKLALLGGKPTIEQAPEEQLFRWPIITEEDEAACLDVIRGNKFSTTEITEQFEDEFAIWQGRKHAVAFCNGTQSIAAAMFAIGLKAGDEIICTTKTYWASIAQVALFGAKAVFCNINDMLSMDPNDLERCITPRTKAIMVVHYLAYPCDMEAIMEIARKYNIYVIEDVSHAQGGLYKGKKLGTFGDVAAMSMMSQKSFAAGEMGMFVTDNNKMYERALAYAHYEKNNAKYIQESEELKPYFNISIGAVKGRVNQLCAALGRGQLRHYDERCAEVRKAMNYFWDLLEDLPGIKAIRVDESTGSNMAGYYCPHGAYFPEELSGLSVKRFCAAVRAEGVTCWEGGNYCLHNHPLFHSFDLHDFDTQTVGVNNEKINMNNEILEVSNHKYCFSVPRFTTYNKEWIERYANAYRKVIENHTLLLDEDVKDEQGGRWFGKENEE